MRLAITNNITIEYSVYSVVPNTITFVGNQIVTNKVTVGEAPRFYFSICLKGVLGSGIFKRLGFDISFVSYL